LWNSHPKVFLPIEEQGGSAKCPYCGAEYILEN
ncbi:zinc-finger domain-containing protein, partial [Dokdonella sp.]